MTVSRMQRSSLRPDGCETQAITIPEIGNEGEIEATAR